jgi:DNA invertase Pin-like site-specific DNA recombinase
MRAAIYLRVSTLEQHVENQAGELRQYVERRGWDGVEYVDRGVSGAKDRRPALDELLRAARRRRFDVLVCWRLDRLGRNLRHLVMLIEELQALGIAFVSLAEGIDATTPAGRLQLHILGAIAEFERARIAERVRAGLERARRDGRRLGRREGHPPAERRACGAVSPPGGRFMGRLPIDGCPSARSRAGAADGTNPRGGGRCFAPEWRRGRRVAGCRDKE